MTEVRREAVSKLRPVVGKRRAVIAAGALVWRVTDGELEVLAVHRPAYNDWSWPKGKVDRGETLPECAVREVYEETGRQVVLGQALPGQSYKLPNGQPKKVRYWAAEAVGPSHPALLARPRYHRAPTREVDKVKWLTVARARKQITMKSDLKVLDALVKAHEAGRLTTTCLVLTRHARAKKRAGWRHDDLARPLTVGGARRAQQLVRLFAAFGVRVIHSSPAARSVQTVQPYATAIGKKITTHDALSEPAHAANPDETAEAFRALLAMQKSRVVCVHRPTMPTLLDIIAASMRKWTRGKLPKENPYLPAGGVLIAHVVETETGPRVAAVERHLLA